MRHIILRSATSRLQIYSKRPLQVNRLQRRQLHCCGHNFRMFRRSISLAKTVGLRSPYRAALGLTVVSAGAIASKPKTLCTAAPSAEVAATFKPTIYQYVICPFCSRVKAYLDFCGVEYETVEVDPLLKGEIVKLHTATRKVPVAVINGAVVEDSANIIEVITQMGKNKEIESFPTSDFFPADTQEWTLWSEKKLAVMLYPNISRNLEESWECFSYAEDVPTWNYFQRKLIRFAGTGAMTAVNGKIKAKYHIKDERAELKETILVWTEALQGKKFLHGDKVTMPDVMVFGVLRAIKGLRTFNEVMAENPALKEWYANVEAAVPAKKAVL